MRNFKKLRFIYKNKKHKARTKGEAEPVIKNTKLKKQDKARLWKYMNNTMNK